MDIKTLLLDKKAVQVAEFFKKELTDEFVGQGHRDTGKFEKSIEYDILTNVDTIEIVFSYLKYGIFLEKGVSSNKIPFGGGASKKATSLYIEALKNWAARKGMLKPLSAAFAIAKMHKKEGMPTKGSVKFSKNGRRRNFQSFTLKANRNFANQFFSAKDIAFIQTLLIDILNRGAVIK
jgi:hypothetical protein